MYKTVVAWQVEKAFSRLNQGDYRAVTGQLHPQAVYEFAGEHALGGRRTGRDLIEAWFARMFRILRDGRFEVRDVLVKGMPWATRVVSIVDVTATAAGEPYANRMIQVLDMEWGRITAIYTLEDTQYLARALDRVAESGVAEAAAQPITG